MGAPAIANDSLAELATGGLVFEKSSEIEMLAPQAQDELLKLGGG